jgi:hypothetical protein
MMDKALADAARLLSLKVPDLGKGKTFEAVVLLKLSLAIAGPNGRCEPRTHDGKWASRLLLRGGPGHIRPAKARGKVPGYMWIDAGFGGAPLEAHNSVEFVGVSRVEHEMDIAVVEERVAAALRNGDGGPVQGAPLLGIELKEFDPRRMLDKNVTRAFLACILDLMPLRHISSCRVGPATGGTDMRADSGPGQFWIATTAQMAKPSVDLARFYNVKVAADLNPASLETALEEISGDFALLAVMLAAWGR